MFRYFFALSLLVTVSISTAQASEVPTSTTNITKDDLRSHPVGKEVGDLNDRIRQLDKNSKQFPKGEDSYQALVGRYEKLVKDRDRIGDDLRNIHGFEIILYGDRAIGNPAAVKQTAINFYMRNPNLRHMQPFHAYYDKNGKGPFVSTTPPSPEVVLGQPQQPPVSNTTDIILAPDQDVPKTWADDDPCAYIFGMPNPAPECN